MEEVFYDYEMGKKKYNQAGYVLVIKRTKHNQFVPCSAMAEVWWRCDGGIPSERE